MNFFKKLSFLLEWIFFNFTYPCPCWYPILQLKGHKTNFGHKFSWKVPITSRYEIKSPWWCVLRISSFTKLVLNKIKKGLMIRKKRVWKERLPKDKICSVIFQGKFTLIITKEKGGGQNIRTSVFSASSLQFSASAFLKCSQHWSIPHMSLSCWSHAPKLRQRSITKCSEVSKLHNFQDLSSELHLCNRDSDLRRTFVVRKRKSKESGSRPNSYASPAPDWLDY